MQPKIIKLFMVFLAGMIVAVMGLMSLSTWTRPQPVSLGAASLKVSVVTLDGEHFVAVTGPPFNALGAHQYLAYSVGDDKVELDFFVTRIAFPNEGAFQADWPLLIPQSKFLGQRVRLTCKSRSGEQLIATIVQTGGGLEIQRSDP